MKGKPVEELTRVVKEARVVMRDFALGFTQLARFSQVC